MADSKKLYIMPKDTYTYNLNNNIVMQQDQYQRQSDAQDYADYCPSGYHPVTLGQIFNQTYTVIQKLGWGHFSTVWLVKNNTSNAYSALKIQRSKDTHTQSAIDQLEMLTEIRKHQQDGEWLGYLGEVSNAHKELKVQLCRPLLLLDNFAHYGIAGKHMCSVFELMGPNLLDVIQHYEFKEKRMPLWLVKKITRQVLLGLVYLHERCGIIHTDLKPQNIMIKMETAEQEQLISQLKEYKVKPLSMKYLKNLQASKNPKNKKKQDKKKKKKALAGKKQEGDQEDKQQKEEDEENSSSMTPSSSQQQSSQSASSQPLSSAQEQSASKISQQQDSQKVKQDVKAQQSNKKQEKVILEQSMKAQEIVKMQQGSKVQQGMKPEQGIKVQQKQPELQFDQYTDIQDGIDMSTLTWKSVKIRLNDKLFFKIADMGNACFTSKHFTQDIQTRQYRSPQVILGHQYGPNTDVFSLACTVFEMMTNNFLFKPKKIPGINKNQDHLFQMIQALGNIDKQYALGGKNSPNFFNKKGKLLSGSPKEQISLSKMLVDKYGYIKEVAEAAEVFLMPMLAFEPKIRVSARECLGNPWLWQ